MKHVSRPELAALDIPAADGYQYADDHPWSSEQQMKLVDWLKDADARQRNVAIGHEPESALDD